MAPGCPMGWNTSGTKSSLMIATAAQITISQIMSCSTIPREKHMMTSLFAVVPLASIFGEDNALLLGRGGALLLFLQGAGRDRFAFRHAHLPVQQTGMRRLDVDA